MRGSKEATIVPIGGNAGYRLKQRVRLVTIRCIYADVELCARLERTGLVHDGSIYDAFAGKQFTCRRWIGARLENEQR
jgi:hypothetical protein